MTKVLITGFTPFPGAPENPAAVLVEAIKAGDIKPPPGASLEARLLPTEFEGSWKVFEEELRDIKPDAIIQFGLSAKASGFTLECVARNQLASTLPDNSGFRPNDETIAPGAPMVLPTSLPLQDIYGALAARKLPVDYSDSAGAYVCNHLFYKTMALRLSKAGFIHIPYLEDQRSRLETEGRIDKGLMALSEAQLFEGVETILKVIGT